MFKFVVLVALCGIMIAESKPSPSVESTDNNYRVVRSAQHVENALNLAGQMANEGLQAAANGVHVLASAAQQGLSAGTQMATQMAKSAMSMG